jgi:hypothetical protein
LTPSRAILPQFLTLGVVFSLGGLIVNGAVGTFAGSIGQAGGEIGQSVALAFPDQRHNLRRAGPAAGADALMPRS